MRRLRVYVVAYYEKPYPQCYMSGVLTCWACKNALLIEPHFFHKYYSRSGRCLCKNGFRNGRYDTTANYVRVDGFMGIFARDASRSIDPDNKPSPHIMQLYDL